MKKMLLTSTGLSTSEIRNELLKMFNKPVNQIRCLFIPTAAVDKESMAVVSLCFNEIIDLGVLAGNITTYNCDRYLSESEFEEYDLVYVCGGDENYLMKKINECNIQQELKKAVEKDLIYVGVSAGAMIASNLKDKKGLNLINLNVNPHATENVTEVGTIFNKQEQINLADDRAIVIFGRHMHLV